MIFLAHLVVCLLLIKGGSAIQFNNTCSPQPNDRRQLICSCSKQLQLRCSFKYDILQFETKDLDRTLRPISFDEVSIERVADSNDNDDLNRKFLKQKESTSVVSNYNMKTFYLYFPNFELFSSPNYVAIALNRFIYLPSYAFNSNENLEKRIDSLVMELQETYDFGIDQYALSNIQVENSIIIEGPFNYLTTHRSAFQNSFINELVIGCYCIECETHTLECNLKLNQPSKYIVTHSNNKFHSIIEKSPHIKSLKLFSVSLDFKLADLPSIETLEGLEITNSKKITINSVQSNLMAKNLTRFVFKNNKLSSLNQLIKIMNSMKNLKHLTLSQNQLSSIDELGLLIASKTLLDLNLERNLIQKLEKFRLFPNLRTLNLNSNQIGSLDENLFEELFQIEFLDLSNNRLTQLNRNAFSGLKNLKTLLLSHNPFKHVHPDAFSNVPNLLRLDLISNSNSDWFTLENNDVCLLSELRECNKLKININPDQGCNCFVKYVGLLSSNNEHIIKDNCKYDNEHYKNLNKFIDEANQELIELDDGEDSLTSTQSVEELSGHKEDDNKRKKLLRELDYENFKHTCLNSYADCLNTSTNICLKQLSAKYTKSIQQNGGTYYNSAHQVNNKEVTETYETESSVSSDLDGEKRIKQSPAKFILSLIDGLTASESSLFFILIALTIVFVIAVTSLFLGVYLVLNRNRYKYDIASNHE
jgi:hypothetical protein